MYVCEFLREVYLCANVLACVRGYESELTCWWFFSVCMQYTSVCLFVSMRVFFASCVSLVKDPKILAMDKQLVAAGKGLMKYL